MSGLFLAQDVMQSVQKKAGKRNSQFMGKDLFIAEKPSVAKEFAKVLGVSGNEIGRAHV